MVACTPVAHDVRRITIARPPRGRAAPGSHVDVRVPLGEGSDVRSYSVVESSDDGGAAHDQRAAGAAVARRIGVHARPCARGRARGDAAAAELPAPCRRPSLRAAGRRHRHHRGDGDGAGAPPRRRRLHARVRRAQPRTDGLRRRAGRAARRPAGAARRRRGHAARRGRAGEFRRRADRALHVRADPADGRRTTEVAGRRAARRRTCATRPSAAAAGSTAEEFVARIPGRQVETTVRTARRCSRR